MRLATSLSLAVLLSFASSVQAQEFIDQTNGPSWTLGGTIMLYMRSFDPHPAQQFTPAWPNLVRIEIMVFAINPTSPEADVTLALYRGGTLIASRSTRPVGATRDSMVWARFDFGITVTPGAVYEMRVTSDTDHFGWGTGSTYDRGDCYNYGTLQPYTDWGFRTTAICLDADGDGATNGACGGTDCDDSSPSRRPGAAEICNGVDDDCDGATDEELGVGDACTAGVGECARSGVLACNDAIGMAVCGAMPGEPTGEVCNGLDDDCDGEIDDVAGLGDSCSAGMGACASTGELVCDPIAGLACDAVAGAPSAERCGNGDEDCDGMGDEVDPDATASCASDVAGSRCLSGARCGCSTDDDCAADRICREGSCVPAPDAGPPLVADGGAMPDASVADASMPDASIAPPPAAGGCGCRAGASRASACCTLLFALSALLLRRRQRLVVSSRRAASANSAATAAHGTRRWRGKWRSNTASCSSVS